MKHPIHLENRNQDDGRLYSPSAGRNRADIGRILAARLPRGARVLEIASGTGEHGAHICGLRDDIIWQCSDPDADSRTSQNKWALDHPGQMLPSLNIDTTMPFWWNALGVFDAVYCANMIHIAPWEAAKGLVSGAAPLLRRPGNVFLYGPFLEGEATSASNLDFDRNLKGRNPDWGVRDLQSVKHIFADAGFNDPVRIVMPKENRLLIFSK